MISHRHQGFDTEVVAERSVPPVPPGLGVNGHAVFPLVLEQMSWLEAVVAGVISTVVADGAVAPAIVGHHRVSHRAVEEYGLRCIS